MKTYLLLIFNLMVAQTTLAQAPLVGGDGVGNANSDDINKRALSQLLENNGHYLKTSMINYLDTILIDQIPKNSSTEVAAKNFFKKIDKSRIRADIQLSAFIVGQCSETQRPNVSASTKVGVPGATVCFNLEQFYSQNKEKTPEQRHVLLASLGYHEIVHHFQSLKTIEGVREDQAYSVSAYVLNTSTFGNIPTLVWDGAVETYFQMIHCKSEVGPKIGLLLSLEPMRLLIKSKGRGDIAKGTEGESSFRVGFYHIDDGTVPFLSTKEGFVNEDGTIPVVIVRPDGLTLEDTELIHPTYDFLGPVPSMKYAEEFVAKSARFRIKSKVATYRPRFEEAMKHAMAKGLDVNEAARTEAVKYQAGLVDSQIVCEMTGMVQ